MAWTIPKTWVDGEVTTTALLNLHWRDNLLILKTSINDTGRFLGLNAATLVNLDGTNLVGVAKLVANLFTAKNDFGAGAAGRIILPVGLDKYSGIPGNKTAGSAWVEGDYLHYVDEGQSEWRYFGTFVGICVGEEGSCWCEGNTIHYVDADGDERYLTGSTTGMHTDVASGRGSLWVEGDYLHWVRETSGLEYFGHHDLHGDAAHTDSHGDVLHSDSYTDSHTDTHDDTHGDTPHTDIHVDHTDIGHGDTHGDYPHTDTHTDTHGDSYSDSHTDIPHVDSHGDAGHTDYHYDYPEEVGV